MNPPVQLVALDLDGTLLNSDGRVSRRNAAAIARARAAGIMVILATGKTRFSALDVISDLALDAPGVFSQGLIITDGSGAILHEVVLDQVLAGEVIRYVEEAALPHFVYTRDGLVAPAPDPYRDLIAAKYDEPLPQVVGPLSARLDSLPINKILIGDGSANGALRKQMEARFGDRLTVTQAVPEFVELFAQGASKGAGLAWLLRRLDMAPQAVLAVGDGDNDLEMLQLAGIGVAVQNARPGVRAAADFVVAGHDDAGVAEAIARFALKA